MVKFHMLEKSATWNALSPEAMQRYRETALQRRLGIQNRNRQRLERGWVVAREAALVLYRSFKAQKVAAFGSLVHPERFHARSDVDLAVWGVPESDFLRAVAAVSSLVQDIETDVIAVEQAPAALRMTIEKEGVSL